MATNESGTAELLKKRLADAFSAWNETDVKQRTKAHLAALCAREADRPCTPQSVNGWFKTGRMDKMWIPILEGILGTSLGFSASPPPWPLSPSLYAQVISLNPRQRARLEKTMAARIAELNEDAADQFPDQTDLAA